jgi:hypothetical protein
MKVSTQETDDEFIMVKERPYKDLVNTDTLIIAAFLFALLILANLYFLIPIIIFFVGLATLQTLEDNFKIILNKKTKEITIIRYYMGTWKFKSIIYKASDFKSVQVEKQVTTMKDDGRFSIFILTEPSNSDVKGFRILLMKNIDLEDIEHAKVISFLLGLLYETKIKYKVELI